MTKYWVSGPVVSLRKSDVADLDYVLQAEKHPDNCRYVGQWSREKHLAALTDPDIYHLIIEHAESGQPVGYGILAGLQNSSRSLELKRLVVTEKGRGFGRASLELCKKLAFAKLSAHRLWLDVREFNTRAKRLYLSVGFQQEGILRDAVMVNGEHISLCVLSVLEQEYAMEGGSGERTS